MLRARLVARDLTGSALDRRTKRLLKGGRYAMLHGIPRGSRGAEIGVWKGDFSAAILKIVAPTHLYLVDPWMMAGDNRVVFPRSRSGEVVGVDAQVLDSQDGADRVFESVAARFADRDEVEILRSTSLEAALKVDEQSLDWVYIDGSHYYENVRDDLDAWLPRMKPSAIMFGDDYYWRDPERSYAVKRAVDEFIERVKPRSWVVFRGQFMIHL